ncbi:MAG TPA: sodium/proline symporter [Woeseiaceae bacterium]|nr:sodium/proline symporter [Woeseiaceae bacterium]
MTETAVVLSTLIVFNVGLIAIGLWARRRNLDVEDFYLGGRKLGPWVAALSASASSSSAWTLLGVSGAAYAWGLPALWLFPATVGGFFINWAWVAPRVRRLSREEGAITLAEMVAPASLGSLRTTILRVIAAIVVFSFVFYIASQFEAAGKAFEATFGLSKQSSILVGACVVLAYTLLGGFWAVSVTDCLQGLLMVVAAALLPAVSLVAVGGISGLAEGLAAVGGPSIPAGQFSGVAGLLFVLAAFGITIGYPGQPHVVNRYMALRDDRALAQGRTIALAWAVLVYAGMLTVGLCARVLFADLGDAEQALFEAARQLLPAVLAGILLVAILSAVMSTVDSQLLVASSSLSHDWQRSKGAAGLAGSRLSVVAILAAATLLALAWRADIFSRVLFAWVAVGAALGPVLVIRLTGRELTPRGTLAAVLAGFLSTLVFAALPDTPGDFAERVIPFAIALAVALASVRPLRMGAVTPS